MDKAEAEASPSSLMEAAEAKVITKEGSAVGGDGKCHTFIGVLKLLPQIFIWDTPVLALLHGFFPAAIYLMMTSDGKDSQREALTFACCLLACVPLAERLGYATEQLTSHVGECAAGLLNASFGNVPELVVTIIAVARGMQNVAVQTLVGGVLSSLLVVSGLSAFFGGAP